MYRRERQKKRGQGIPKKRGEWVDNKFVDKRLRETMRLETRKQVEVHEECAFRKEAVLLITSCL